MAAALAFQGIGSRTVRDVCERRDVSIRQVVRRRGKRPLYVSAARREIAAILSKRYGWSYRRIAHLFGCTHQSVGYYLKGASGKAKVLRINAQIGQVSK